MSNPLLEPYELPPFSRIRAEHVEPAIQQRLTEYRSAIQGLLEPNKTYTWANLVAPLEELDDRLNRTWSPVSHLNAVANEKTLREVYTGCLPLLSDFTSEMGQNEELYRAYCTIVESPEYDTLNEAQKKVLCNALRDFRLSGVDLPPIKKQRYKEVVQALSQLSSQFQDNVLDATQAWSKHIENEALLAGIPETACIAARQFAESKGKKGWIFTLDFPSYMAVMAYAEERKLRRECYTAYTTRASDQGPHGGRWDNTEIMEKILALRHEEASLLGFRHFADLSLATKMAASTESVTRFLTELAERCLPHAQRDMSNLRTFAATRLGIHLPEPWDLPYISEKFRQEQLAFSQEEIRSYFPAPTVIAGLFSLVERLYGLSIKKREDVDMWHPDVTYYDIYDRSGEKRGSFYLDMYTRPNKRGGAWMDEYCTRRRVVDCIQHPVAYLTCNFSPPVENIPSLLRHDEVLTLFHEFGHGLHHLLTQVDCSGVSGIHGVEWDAVELPSQFMENFCWEPEILSLISGHYETGEPLPHTLIHKLIADRTFQSGMQMARQVEFALFDFRLHHHYDPTLGGRIYTILNQVRRQVSVVIPPAFNRFAHQFSHIFSGGYAAGYYGYHWAEVLSSDAYSLFEEKGLFNQEVACAFLETILERGGSNKAMDLFVSFRGREPKIDALLRHHGIVET